MNRWDHGILAIIVFSITWGFFQYVYPNLVPANLSFLFIIVFLLGGYFPDFDSDWKPFLGHRSYVTHSILAPLILVTLVVVPLHFFSLWLPLLDRYFGAIFLFGCGFHLILDLYPSSTSVLNRFLKNPLEALEYIEHSQKAPPGNITKIPKKWERPWLITNAILLFIIAALLWFFLA